MNTRAPHKTFDLTYTPKYGFSIFYLIFHVGVIIILLVGLILNFRNYDLLFKIISIIFLLAFCINIFSIVELVGRESVGISHDSIIWTQTLYGISKKRVLPLNRIKSIKLIDLKETFIGSSYIILGFTDYKIEIRRFGKRIILIGKYITQPEGNMILFALESLRNSKTA